MTLPLLGTRMNLHRTALLYVADFSLKVVNNEMLRKLTYISLAAVKLKAPQSLHVCLHLQ